MAEKLKLNVRLAYYQWRSMDPYSLEQEAPFGWTTISRWNNKHDAEMAYKDYVLRNGTPEVIAQNTITVERPSDD